MRNKVETFFSIEQKYYKAIQKLPWNIPITEWEINGEYILKIKSGISRHPVIFVHSLGFDFAIKEISPDVSKREILNYEEILKRGVHTLLPIGFVIRKEEPLVITLPTGIQYENSDVAHTITLIASRVLPDSTLVTRSFQEKNRKRIWDAIIELFLDLHINNIYWGDASLANILIRFDKVELPDGKKITKLRAVLADAETVEIYDNISDSMRFTDLDFFFESMEWIYEDLKVEGIFKEESDLQKCKEYIYENYRNEYELRKCVKNFETETNLNFRKDFQVLPSREYIEIIEKQIQEHKWYLGEKRENEISIKEAAKDWYENIFIHIRELLISNNVLSHFKDKTVLDIYIEIMKHKYFLSKELGNDVGIIYAIEDYSNKFSENEPLIEKILSVAKSLLKIIGI